MTDANATALRFPVKGLLALIALPLFWSSCEDDSGANVGSDSGSDLVSSDAESDSAPSPEVVSSQGWTVSAGRPVLEADGALVVGSVTFERTSGAETRGGGVCLVADLHDSFPCSTADDCAGLDLPEDGYHYCSGVNGSPDRICWTRPGGDPYCTRNPARTPGTYSTSAVPSVVDGEPTTWMSNACMAVETSPMGCGSGDPSQYVTATSPTLEVRP